MVRRKAFWMLVIETSVLRCGDVSCVLSLRRVVRVT
jgi:hypothetical protein